MNLQCVLTCLLPEFIIYCSKILMYMPIGGWWMFEFGHWTEVKFDSLNYQSIMRVLIAVISECYADLLDNWFLRQACRTCFSV
jgi:hypothetical protein